MQCFPTFVLILTVIAFVGSSIWTVMVGIGLTSWTGLARMVRGEFLSLKDREFVLGASDARIIFQHVLPTARAPVFVSATLGGAISSAQATLAALLRFGLARAFGEPLVARLMPLVPFDPISYVAGFTRMRAPAFVWATLIGQIPAGMDYAYVGQGIDRPRTLAITGACAVLALIALGALARRVLAGQALWK